MPTTGSPASEATVVQVGVFFLTDFRRCTGWPRWKLDEVGGCITVAGAAGERAAMSRKIHLKVASIPSAIPTFGFQSNMVLVSFKLVDVEASCQVFPQ